MNHGTYLIEDLNLMILMRSDIFYGCNSVQIMSENINIYHQQVKG